MDFISPIISMLSNAWSSVTAWIGFSKQKDDQLNSNAMVANKTASLDEAQRERIEADVTKSHTTGDLTEVRKDLAP